MKLKIVPVTLILLFLVILVMTESPFMRMDEKFYSADMEKSILDVLEEPFEEEGRILNFDRGAAFNTSVAFTIPLFSFTLPGALETSVDGIVSNSFGVLAFVALFLLGGLGVAIYTTSQGGNADGARNLLENTYLDNPIMHTILDSVEGLPEALNFDSCSKLAVCSAHAEYEKYGLLAWPFRVLFPSNNTSEHHHRSRFNRAAFYGAKREDECYYEYPCLIEPLDTLIYVRDLLFRST